MSVRKFLLISLLVAILCLSGGICRDSPEVSGEESGAPFLSELDQSVRPGEDFFQYANGGWLKRNPVPPDKGEYGSFHEVSDRTLMALQMIAEESTAANGLTEGSVIRKLGDFYHIAMDVSRAENQGISPILEELRKIDEIDSIDEVEAEAAYLQTLGIDTFFEIFAEPDPEESSRFIARIWQGGIELPDRDYYISPDREMEKIRFEYEQHIARIFKLSGDGKGDAGAKVILRLETELAKASQSNVENRDTLKVKNIFSADELERLAPSIRWKSYFSSLGYPGISRLNIGQPEFLKGVSDILGSVPVAEWRIFLRWKLLSKGEEYLSSPFENEHFEFWGKSLEGKRSMKPRWERVLRTINLKLGELTGEIYVRKHFPEGAKLKMLTLTENLKAAFREIIARNPWMSEETKARAIEKLDAMRAKIGYPDKWQSFSDLTVRRDSYVLNVLRAENFQFRFGPSGLENVGKRVDKSRWDMPPQIVNAMYDPFKNEILFPAAILQPPFFDMNADDASNYGAIGTIIGHEITHGFDDEGRHFDSEGNVKEWWTEKDDMEFRKRARELVEQFGSYEVLPGVFINGELTLGENIADLGGLQIAYRAYLLSRKKRAPEDRVGGFTPEQRFFLAYARMWRDNIRDETLKKQVKIDVHSPNRYRVNGSLFDIPEFYEAFPTIKPGDRLYRPPGKRPVIWGIE